MKVKLWIIDSIWFISILIDLAPGREFESARRKLDRGIIEFWRYASTHLKALNELHDLDKVENLGKEMVDFMTEQKK